MSGIRFELDRAENGELFWRMKDGDNQIVGNSAETYNSTHDARRSLANVLSDLSIGDDVIVWEMMQRWNASEYIETFLRDP